MKAFGTQTMRLIYCCWIAFVLGCGSPRAAEQSSPPTVGDVVEFLRDSGLKGKYTPKQAGMIGAAEGGRYAGDGFVVEIYRFEDESKAKSLEKTGINDKKCYRSGSLILFAHEGEDKVSPVFKKFSKSAP